MLFPMLFQLLQTNKPMNDVFYRDMSCAPGANGRSCNLPSTFASKGFRGMLKFSVIKKHDWWNQFKINSFLFFHFSAIHSVIRKRARIDGSSCPAWNQEDAFGPPGQLTLQGLRHTRRQIHQGLLGPNRHGHFTYQVSQVIKIMTRLFVVKWSSFLKYWFVQSNSGFRIKATPVDRFAGRVPSPPQKKEDQTLSPN